MSLVDRLVTKLGSIGSLSPSDLALLSTLPITAKRLLQDESVVVQGDHPVHSVIVLNGALARFQELSDGERQMVSVHLKGEMPDLHSLFIAQMDHSLVAIQESVVGLVPHADLHRVCNASATLMALLWRETLIDAAITRQWLTNNGHRGSLQGTAHLLCELFVRASSINDLTPHGTWEIPLKQHRLAEALGLSLVTINRTLKALREAKVAAIENGELRVINFDELQRIAGFDATYLHLKSPVT